MNTQSETLVPANAPYGILLSSTPKAAPVPQPTPEAVRLAVLFDAFRL